jgi:hypothetical protein
MKFLQIMGRVWSSSYTKFEFSDHNADLVCIGDSIWSNGHELEIADYVESDDLRDLISQVDNKQAFSGALRRMGFEF